MNRVLIVGGGGHAKVVVSLLKRLGAFEIIGYTDLRDRGSLLGAPYLGGDDVWPAIRQTYSDGCSAAIGIGYVTINSTRRGIFERLGSIGFALPAIVAPSAVVNEAVVVGEGTVVMDGVVINSGSVIGRGVIVNTKASIDHDCTIGDFAHIAPGAVVCGEVSVGGGSIVGAGATVIQQVSIAENCFVGAGAVVTANCRVAGRYVGVPARSIG